MAITNAQQFKQLVNPPKKGKKRPGYRGDAAYGSASEQSSLGAGPGPGADFGDGPASSRDPMAQFSENVDTKDLTFMDEARKSVNPLGVLTEVPGGIGLLARILSPDPFRPRPKIKNFVGRQDRADDSQIVLPIISKQEPIITEDEDEEEKPIERFLAFRADGGRIEAQEGGIMPRLNQLGSGVSSAEQTLQDINQRLESAESSLGGSGESLAPNVITGGRQVSDLRTVTGGGLAEIANNLDTFPGNPNRRPPSLDKIAPGFKTGQPTAQLFGSIQNLQNQQDVVDLAQLYPNAGQNKISDFRPMRGGAEMFEAAGIPAAGYADGGNVVGGEFDFESARQMYGLGKLVKKVTRTVKKIAKSPVGKAALLYVGGAGLGALGTGTGFAGFKAGLMSPSLMFKNLATSGKGFLTGISRGAIQFPGAAVASNAPGAFKLGQFLTTGKGIGTAITAASLLPLLGIGTGEETEEEAEELIRGSGLDINAIRANPNQFLARRFRAEGGSMKEPVAKKTMPLLDLDGKEMDLRAEGGFVPIGRMEKADDVPARLSKNEFVFTADAVRNAGDGDVDKGAEVMYNMMKNLESGGDVSEESQGLKGARKMFQTSQRLEEVL